MLQVHPKSDVKSIILFRKRPDDLLGEEFFNQPLKHPIGGASLHFHLHDGLMNWTSLAHDFRRLQSRDAFVR